MRNFTQKVLLIAVCILGSMALTQTANAQLSGSYSIGGTGADYSSPAAFASALNSSGVSGAVTGTITTGSGPFTGQVVFNAITGASSTNTITLDGNGETIQYNSSSSSSRHIIKLNGTDYMTLDNIVVQPVSSSSYCWAIHLQGAANYNTIKNCVITPTSSYTTSQNYCGIMMNNSVSSYTSGIAKTGNTIEGNKISYGGYFGISSRGGSTSSKTSNLTIDNNEIEWCYRGINLYYYHTGTEITDNDVHDNYYGIYNYYYTDYALIDGNTIKYGQYGLYSYGYSTGSVISNNDINMDNSGHSMWSTRSAYGMFVGYYATNMVVERNKVISQFMGIYSYGYRSNNMVVKNNSTACVLGGYSSSYRYPLYAYAYYATSCKWYNNSTWAPDGLSYTYNYIYGYLGTSCEYVNNSIMGSGTYGVGYVYYTSAFDKIDHNNYYAYGGSTLIYWEGSALSSISAIRSATGPSGHDVNSNEGDPGYCEPEAGDLTPLTTQLNNAGSLAATGGTVTNDINLNSRPLVSGDSIDIGCHEFNPPNYNLGVTDLTSPTPQDCYTSAMDLELTVKNNGLMTWSFATDSIQITAVVTLSGTPTTYTSKVTADSLTSGSSANFLVSSVANFGAAGTYTLKAWATPLGSTSDGLAKDDTMEVTFDVTPSIDAFPYLEDFETFGISTSYQGHSNGDHYDNGWVFIGGNHPWTGENGSGYPYRQNQGISDHTYECGTTAGTFMMVEASANDYYDADETYEMVSPCFNLDTMNCPQLSFFHQGWNNSDPGLRGDLHVDVLSGGTWDMAVYTIPEGPTHQDVSCAYTEHLVPLADYAGESGVRVRFRAMHGNTTGYSYWYYADQAIDDVAIYEVGDDIAVSEVIMPEGCEFGTTEEITATICNFSCDTVFSGDYQVLWSSTHDSSAVTSSFEFPGDILPNDCITYTFSTTNDMHWEGTYTIDVVALFTSASGITDDNITDNLNTGNEIEGVIANVMDEAIAFSDDFETSTAAAWSPETFTAGGCETCTSGGGGGSTAGTLWQLGTPSKGTIDTASSGVRVWMTDTASGFSSGDREVLVSPCFDFSCVLDPELTLDINHAYYGGFGSGASSYGYDGTFIEYSIDGGDSWSLLGGYGTGTNWYNVGRTYGVSTSAMHPSWSGTSSGWETAIHDLSFLRGEAGVHFRFHFAAYRYGPYGSTDGFAFDNFTVTEKYFDQTTDYCPAVATTAPVTGDVYGATSFTGETCCETGDVTEDPSTAPSCWTDGFDNSTYFPIKTSAATGHRTLNVFISVDFNAGGSNVQAAMYGPFSPGTCPSPSGFGAPVRCAKSPGPFIAMGGILVTDPDEIYILVLDGKAGECAAVTITPFGTALPVELMAFEVEKQGSTAVLDWVTASETNSSFFAIERSVDGVTFEEIGTVTGNGTTSDASYYQFVDDAPVSGINYYRLRQVDFDGSYEYSDIKWVEFTGTESSVEVYPNPFSNELVLDMSSLQSGEVEVVVSDVVGRVVYSETISVVAGTSSMKLSLDSRYASGVYMLSVKGAGFDTTVKVVKED